MRSKVQGRQPTSMKTRKVRKRDPVSTADVKKTKSMDEVLGIEQIHFTNEESVDEGMVMNRIFDLFQAPLSPKSSASSIEGKKKLGLTSPLLWRQMLNVAVTSHKDLPDLIEFEDEQLQHLVGVKYEWKPMFCEYCKGMGHKTSECRKKIGGKQEWVVKKRHEELPGTNKLQAVDSNGFQPIQKGWKPKEVRQPAMTITNNAYKILEETDMEANIENRYLGEEENG
uniref:Uncharacterized protein n=1 Tax=Cannabis sativa TaxID=3483 RepID=A0A803QCE9_CANSA